MLYGLYQNARTIITRTNDVNAIVRGLTMTRRRCSVTSRIPRAGGAAHAASHWARTLYRRCIKTTSNGHQYGNVVTEDLRAVIEELFRPPARPVF